MRQFEVYRGGVKLGRISLDMPSAGGRFEPAPSFESVRHLFEAEARCLDTASDPDISDDEKAHAWALADEAHEAIMGPGIRMEEVGEICSFQLVGLTIDGDRASWR